MRQSSSYDPDLDQTIAPKCPSSIASAWTGSTTLPTSTPALSRRLPNRRVGSPDEDAACSINYTSGTTARPKGVRAHPSQLLAQRGDVRAGTPPSPTATSLLHTLPMFHCNGWGMPYAVTAMGGTHVVLRKVDGEEILSRIESEGVTLLCGAPAVRRCHPRGGGDAESQGRHCPGGQRCTMVVAGAPPPSRTHRAGRDRARVGVHPDLRADRDLTAPDDQPSPGRVGRSRRAPSVPRRLSRAGAPAVGVQIAVDDEGELLARSNHVFAGYWEQPDETARRSTEAGSTPGTVATSTGPTSW